MGDIFFCLVYGVNMSGFTMSKFLSDYPRPFTRYLYSWFRSFELSPLKDIEKKYRPLKIYAVSFLCSAVDDFYKF